MKNYEWYLFDFDNTIIDSNYTFEKALEEVFKIFSVPFSENTFKVYHNINSFYWQEYEKGNISSKKLRDGRFKDFLQEINVQKDADKMSLEYLNLLVKYSIEIKDSFALLDKLVKTSKLALITNGISDVQHKRIEKLNLSKYFQHVFISDEMGVSKPAEKFFEIVHKKIKFPQKENVLVLGDNPNADILGANNFGFHSLFFNFNNYTGKVDSHYKITNWNQFYEL